jgi:GNAT superfamily N-acetyltransferase
MLSIRPASADDATLLATLIRELAEFEHLSHEVAITEEDVLRDGFRAQPRFRAIIAEWDGNVAGYALFFEVYSSFQGKTGVLLEDLFVRSQYRDRGVGKALLASVAEIAL